MWFDRECQGCGYRGSCHSVYYRLGHAKGPSVIAEVLLAFGVPIAVFIASLMISETFLGGVLTNRIEPMLLSLALASMLTLLVVTVIWWFTRKAVDRGPDVREVQK